MHASIMPWTVGALEDATAVGATTSTDLHDWDGRNPHHRPFAYAADLVFVSGSRLDGVEDDVVADVLDRGRARLVVVMDGARGSRVTVREGGSFAVPASTSRVARPSTRTAPATPTSRRSCTPGSPAATPARRPGPGPWRASWACGTAGTHSSLIGPDELTRQLARHYGGPGRD